MATKKRVKTKSLSHGRPPLTKRTASISSKATRTIIRTYHALEKRQSNALANGDDTEAAKILQEIDARGGIKAYQRASLLGQKSERGGDSSKVLMGWLKKANLCPGNCPIPSSINIHAPLRLLEVGALSIKNACSQSKIFDIERIDLNTQAEGITEQDFMERPLPKDASKKFDIISLSLVLNFVPSSTGRGDMLRRTLQFLRQPPPHGNSGLLQYFPSLFLVLPLSCVTNSRYLDEQRLESMMRSLGYIRVMRNFSSKLAYYLWRATDLAACARPEIFKKVKVKGGRSRNNFSIVLKGGDNQGTIKPNESVLAKF
jgi:25S rRNA (adenine2142-N1)-methyltransferase